MLLALARASRFLIQAKIPSRFSFQRWINATILHAGRACHEIPVGGDGGTEGASSCLPSVF
jgi:hypothetical protein